MPPTDTVERIVAGTAHSWTTPHPAKVGEHVYHTARHGDRVQVTAEEAQRGEAMGTLVDEEKARQVAMTRADLEAEIARLTAERDAALANVPPAVLQPPPAPPASTTLTPSMSGIPQPSAPPTDVGPIGPTTADAVAASRAATAGNPVIEVTPGGTPITHLGQIPPPVDLGTPASPGSPAPLPGETATDEQLATMNAAEVVAYLGQNSDNLDEVERVDELEAGRRRGPRKTVTDAIEAIRTARATEE